MDSALKEKLLLESPRNLLWVSVTPDKKQIIVGTAENKDAANNPSREPAESKNKVQRNSNSNFWISIPWRHSGPSS